MKMNESLKNKIDITLAELYHDAKNDYFRIAKGIAKNILRPRHPIHFKNVYLAISKEQGRGLVNLIKFNNVKNIIEFGTSFGISTLFLARGILHTNGNIITTELIASKAKQAIENFTRAGVNELIELRVGNAMLTLRNHNDPIDLLILDGWKDLYLPLFKMLEANFHPNTIIYVDNADSVEVISFLKSVAKNTKYKFERKHSDRVVLISILN